MLGIDDAEKVAEILTPPDDPSDKPAFRRWMYGVSIVTGVSAMASALHIAWACGWLTAVGLGGFALTDTVSAHESTVNQSITDLRQAMAKNQNSVLMTIISGQIVAMHQNACAARRTKDYALAQSDDDQLADMQAKYQQVSGGFIYPLQACP